MPQINATPDQVEATDLLVEGIRNGRTQVALRLIKRSAPQLWNSKPLWAAVLERNIVLVEALLPYSDPTSPRCYAFEMAAQEGFLEGLIAIAPYMDDGTRWEKVFNLALYHGQSECAHFLCRNWTEHHRRAVVAKTVADTPPQVREQTVANWAVVESLVLREQLEQQIATPSNPPGAVRKI